MTSKMQASPYKIDPSHSSMGFKVKHMGISWVRGDFREFASKLDFDPKTGMLSNIDTVIKSTSIDTNQDDRDKHLRSADFFDVGKHPEITFKSTKVVQNGHAPKEIHGKFTMHGVTDDIILTITDWAGQIEDPKGNQRIGFEATGKIDRTKYGVVWNKPLAKAGGLVVSNDVILQIAAEFIEDKGK